MAKIRVKNDFISRFIKTRNVVLLQEFKKYRNCLNKEIKNRKAHYLENSFRAVKEDCKLTWRRLNEVLGRSSVPTPIEELVINGETVHGTALADSFNEHFTNIPGPSLQHDNDHCINLQSSYSLFLSPDSANEVHVIFIELKNSSTCDTHGIQIRPVKFVLDIISPILAHIFNLCFSSGTFRKDIQLAKIKPVYKKGDQNKLNNYRSISILPVFSKGLEKLILLRFESYF